MPDSTQRTPAPPPTKRNDRPLDPEGHTDLSGDGGGQQTEVGPPYSGEGNVQRGERDRYLKKPPRSPSPKP